jgi:hypothetical protein
MTTHQVNLRQAARVLRIMTAKHTPVLASGGCTQRQNETRYSENRNKSVTY